MIEDGKSNFQKDLAYPVYNSEANNRGLIVC